MSDFSYDGIDEYLHSLKLDMSAAELAALSQEERFNEMQLSSIKRVLEYLQQKKRQTTIETMLRMSRLPSKNMKTFDNFDFSVLKKKLTREDMPVLVNSNRILEWLSEKTYDDEEYRTLLFSKIPEEEKTINLMNITLEKPSFRKIRNGKRAFSRQVCLRCLSFTVEILNKETARLEIDCLRETISGYLRID